MTSDSEWSSNSIQQNYIDIGYQILRKFKLFDAFINAYNNKNTAC